MRKIVQIAFEVTGWVGLEGGDYGADTYTGGKTESMLHALCDDGTIWAYQDEKWEIWELPAIPQEEQPK